MINCPNCGAPKEGLYCKYCGTPLYTQEEALAQIIGKTCHFWYEVNGHYVLFDMQISTIDIRRENLEFRDWAGINKHYLTTEASINLNGALKDIDRKEWNKHFIQKI